MSKQTQHQKPQPTASEGLEQRLKLLHPELQMQIESLLAIVENQDGRLEKAAEAELEVVKVVRQLGRQALQEWGQRQADRKAEELPRLNPSACKDKKNSSLA